MNPLSHQGYGHHPTQNPCHPFASTSQQTFSSFSIPQHNPQTPQNQPDRSYGFYKQQSQNMNPNFLQPPPHHGNNFHHTNYSNSGPMQKFQQNYLRQQDTQAWVAQQRGDFSGYYGGFSGPGSTVSSYNGSPAHSVISHISRHSTASQLTVVTNISPAAYCGSALSAPGSENIDPQHEQMAVPHAINQLHANFQTKTLPMEQVVKFLQVISVSASQYTTMEVRRSRIAGIVRDRDTRERLFHYILTQSHEILVQPSYNDPFQILRRIWKLFSFLVRCDECVETLFNMKGMNQNLINCMLRAMRPGNHAPYAVQVLRRLLESRHGAEFRLSARVPATIERLLHYLPHAHLQETPKFSAIASGNKYEIIDCCRILLSGESDPRKTAKARDAETTAVRHKFVEMKGVEEMLRVVREDVEEPVLSAATGALKAIVKTRDSENIAASMVCTGAIQQLAAHLDHGSPTLVQNCLICMARICDQKKALETQPLEKAAIAQTINVLGTSDIQIDQFASAFLVNVATIAPFKKAVVRSGAVKALLRIINQHAYSFFLGRIDFHKDNSRPYVDVLDNSIRVIAYLSRGIDEPAVVQQVLQELTCASDSLQLLANLAKAKPPPNTTLSRSDRKFKFLTRENHLQLRRHVLLIVQRNMSKFGGVNVFRQKLCSFREVEVFPQTAFDIIYELNNALIRIKSEGDESARTKEEMHEIDKLLFNVFPAIIKEFAKAGEFTAGIASCLQSEKFVAFFASFARHDQNTQLQLIDFCSCFLDIKTVKNEASLEAFKKAFPVQPIQRIVEEMLSGNVDVRYAFDRLLLSTQTLDDFNDILMETMDFS